MTTLPHSDAVAPYEPAFIPIRSGNLPAQVRKPGRRVGVAAACLAVAFSGLAPINPASALEFSSGEFQGSLDTTLSHGFLFRVGERNLQLGKSVNTNDGNLNYGRGLVSSTSKITTELDVSTASVGLFLRASGFLDFENRNSARDRTPLSDEALKAVGRDLELLDAYVTGSFDVGEAAVDVRLGKHVLNWGESTFIPNGISVINHFDVGSLRRPGSELRDALLPVSMVSAAISPNNVLSVEGFYQLDWQKTEIDASGTYFSSADYAGPGARTVFFDDPRFDPIIAGNQAGTDWDRGFSFGPLTAAVNADLQAAGFAQLPLTDPGFLAVERGSDVNPADSGQYGIALRYFAEELNQTEFGFYFINYHSRLPVVSARTGTRQGIQAGLGALGALAGGSGAPSQLARAIAGDPNLARLPPQQRDAVAAANAAGIASAVAIDTYVNTGSYFVEYPEDIKLFGLSFNTLLGDWALQGEYSVKNDVPLQRAERTVLADGLAPMITGDPVSPGALEIAGAIAQAQGRLAVAADPAEQARLQQQIVLLGERLARFIGRYEPTTVQGYVRSRVSQAQVTATRALEPIFNADSFFVVGEAAVQHVHDMPEIPIESPAGGLLSAEEADADATSWGVRIATVLDYNNAIGAVNLHPYAQLLHDVSGNSPSPIGTFIEGRTGLTLGLRGDYLGSWEGDLSYTSFNGKGDPLSDRDFVSASIKYSF